MALQNVSGEDGISVLHPLYPDCLGAVKAYDTAAGAGVAILAPAWVGGRLGGTGRF